MARAHSLAQEESKVNESTSVPNSELEKITAHAKSFTQEENKSGEQTLMPNTEVDKIIARAQSITRRESIPKEPNSVSSTEMNMIISGERIRSSKKTSQMNQHQTRKIRTRLCFLRQRILQATKAITKLSSLEEHQTRNMWLGQMNRSSPEDGDLADIIASIENVLSKLKERLHRRDASGMREVRQSVQHFPTLRTFVVDCFANDKFSTNGGLSLSGHKIESYKIT